jgi:predicted ATPase/class 3 adenylate cyclase
MNALPSGIVTFLFTDIEGSTSLWEKHPEAMKSALAKHDSILKSAVESNHGYVIKTTGDGVHAVFEKAADAANAAIGAQLSLKSLILDNSDVASIQAGKSAQPYSTTNMQVKVRMGLHTGEAELRDGDYFGQTLNRAARIMSAGHGGQILVSDVTVQVAREYLPADVSLFDLGEHHLKGLLHAEKIYQVVAPDLQKDFPPLNSIPTATNNLPAQLTSFIGREREMAEATKRLENARLLTLIGPGGTGKTRLSIQLGTEMLSHFRDGVWFIELAPLADPALIVQTVASVLGVRSQIGMPLMTIVLDYLRAKNLLLILDNCEHLVEASAALADEFLHNAPQVNIIASSREALGIAGEAVYRVPSLSLPNQVQASREAAMRFESVQLFVDRASATNPKFHLTDENASSVAQICSRLDGIPLALELAASRVSVFTTEQIAKRLDDRFKLLTGGSRTALPRQQTLRALIDWSYDILSLDECKLLRRLSVFSGGWIFEAAEAMFDDMDVLDLLPQLVNKSLATMDDEGKEPRYRLLETIRQYARDKLLESGEAAEIRNRHLDYHVRLAESAELHLYGKMALNWVNRLEAEYDNLRAAIEWGLDNNVMAVLRMAGALPNFWFRRGYESESLRWIREALERVKSLPEVEGEAARERLAIIAKSWQSVSFMAFSQGDMLNASAAAATCAGYARQLGDKKLLATVLTFEASSKMMSGRFNDVDGIMQEVLDMVDETNDPLAIGRAYGMIGSRMIMAGKDNEEARALVAKGLTALKDSEDSFGHTMILFATAMGARFNGRFDEARAGFAPLVPIFREMGDHHRSNMVQSEMAHMERLEGHHEKATAMYRETILIWKRLGHRAAVANQFECFAFIAKAHEQLERAAILLGAAEALRELINIDMSALERVEYEREVADLKANMSEKDFNAAWSKGRAMGMDEAVELAVEK